MIPEGLWQTDLPWLDGSGGAADMVVSTRARLARNLAGAAFTHGNDEGQLERRRREPDSGLLGQ